MHRSAAFRNSLALLITEAGQTFRGTLIGRRTLFTLEVCLEIGCDVTDGVVEEWISSAEALALMVSRTGNEHLATNILHQMLDRGSLKARANAYAQQVNFGPIPVEIPDDVSDRTLRVKTFAEGKYASLNMSSANRALTGKLSWIADWRGGSFAMVEPPAEVLIKGKMRAEFTVPLRNRMVFFNVEFLEAEIREIFVSTPPLKQAGRGRSGPRLKKWDFTLELAQLRTFIDRGLMEQQFRGVVGDYGMQAKIERYLINALRTSELEPPEGTVRRHAQTVMKQWRAHVATQTNLF